MSAQPTLDPLNQEIPKKARRRWFVPQIVAEEIVLLKNIGIKPYFKDRGPWVFVAIFLFYLVRDVTLYIIIPYLVLNGIISCPGPAS